MSYGHEVIMLQDELARKKIDDQLRLIANEDPALAITTERTVFARDPLKSISNLTDALMVTPHAPLDNSVDVGPGIFYSRGILYTFHGRNSGPLPLPSQDFTHILVAVKVDRITGNTELYVGTEYGKLPMFHPDTLPLAIVRVHPEQGVIRSEDIIDIRPWINFDLTHPHDRVVVDINCLASGESVAFDRRPYHQGLPLLAVYQRLAPSDDFVITQTYDSIEMATPIYNGELLDFDEVSLGVTIKKNNARMPVEFGGSDNIVFVSSQYGTPYGNGTKQSPCMTLEDAAILYNSSEQYDTIFLMPGVYAVPLSLDFDKDTLIVGQSTEEVFINFLATSTGVFCTKKLEMRTVTIVSLIAFDPLKSVINCNDIWLANCVVLNRTSIETTAIVNSASGLVMTHCVLDNQNQYYSCMLWHSIPTGDVGLSNSIVLGHWVTDNPAPGPSVWTVLQDDPTGMGLLNLENAAVGRYRPQSPSVCIDTGVYSYTGADKDGSAPDIGIYGGQFAAYADIITVPINVPLIIKYSIQTMFSPIIKRFRLASMGGNVPAGTEIYGAVSFDGGYKFVAWNEGRAEWHKINLEKIHEQGNTHLDLLARLEQMGPLETKGEIVLAWGLISHDITRRPILTKTEFRCEISPNAAKLVPINNLDIYVDDFTVIARNNTEDKLSNLVFVAY